MLFPLHYVINFLMHTWIWHMTWGWYQFILSNVLLAIIVRLTYKIRFFYTVMLSLLLHASTYALFTFFVFIFIYLLNWQYHPLHENYHSVTIFYASSSLAIVYISLQMILLYLFALKRKSLKSLKPALYILVVTHLLATIFATLMVQVKFL